MSRERETGRRPLRKGSLSVKGPPDVLPFTIQHSPDTIYWTRYRQETGQIHVLVTKYDRADKTGPKRPDVWFRRW